MKQLFVFYVSSVLALTACAQQTAMSALQERTARPGQQLVMDTRAWKFCSGAPVRATPLAANGNIYIGNAQGNFYCINQATGVQRWVYHNGAAIHSTAACYQGMVFFTDNRQQLHALDRNTGRCIWTFSLGKSKEYPWKFNYYYASPVVRDGTIYTGSADGYFYAIRAMDGKQVWKFQCKGPVMGAGAFFGNTLIFGDSEARIYSVQCATGHKQWEFAMNGDTLVNEKWGFDRRAVLATPAIAGNRVVIGGRDGFLYCLDAANGNRLWTVDHRISWIISTVAISDSFVITGTSDGRFVQAVDLFTGRERWKFTGAGAIWSSPLVVDDYVYAGSFNGQLYCLSLHSGERVSQFATGGMILSSPVWANGMLVVGSDDGNVYALNGHPDQRKNAGRLKRFVYFEDSVHLYFHNNADIAVRNYLLENGFTAIGRDLLEQVLASEDAASCVIVVASCYFPPPVVQGGEQSPLRKFLDAGGRLVLPGTLPTVYRIDERSKQAIDFDRQLSKDVFGLDYGTGDTRSFQGLFPCAASAAGKRLGLPDQWVSSLFIDSAQVDLILGNNENGAVSAFLKRYKNNGSLVQLWLNADAPGHQDGLIKAAEWEL